MHDRRAPPHRAAVANCFGDELLREPYCGLRIPALRKVSGDRGGEHTSCSMRLCTLNPRTLYMNEVETVKEDVNCSSGKMTSLHQYMLGAHIVKFSRSVLHFCDGRARLARQRSC